MVRCGLFHTVGHTEVDGLHFFLRRIGPDVFWDRQVPNWPPGRPPKFVPSNQRHAPTNTAVPPTAYGLTGQPLVETMLRSLRGGKQGAECEFDFVLLVDDADCRFRAEPDPEAFYERWLAGVTRDVREATGKPSLGFFALLAFPEVETWLLADWENGFGHLYRGLADPLRRHVEACILSPLAWSQVEDFGGPLERGSCRDKISKRLQEAFHESSGCRCSPELLQVVAELPSDQPNRYSKRKHGADMLKQIDPEQVGRLCPRFQRVLSSLRAFCSQAPS